MRWTRPLVALVAASTFPPLASNAADEVSRAPPRAAALPSDAIVVPPEATAAFPGSSGADRLPDLGEEIVVTGSRIPRKDLATPAPVTIVTREQVLATGARSIAEFLQWLPEQANGQNAQVNNAPPTCGQNSCGGDGASYVALRGLQPSRTLVLMNGRRLAPNGSTADVDLNTIPMAAVERVEILKDGASPVYGADAVAGVVNVITRRAMTGSEVAGSAGLSTHGDAFVYQLDGTTGLSGSRGALSLSVGFQHQNPLMAGSRPFSAVPRGYDQTGAYTERLTGTPRIGEDSQGSGIIPDGRVTVRVPGVANGNALWNQLVGQYPTTTSFMPDKTQPLGWRPFRPNLLPPDGDAYNFQPDNYLLTPLQRLSVFGTGELALGSAARAYSEVSFVERRSSQRFAPSPLAISPGSVPVTVSADNPYNPFGRDFTQVSRRLVEFPARTLSQTVDSARLVLGLDGHVEQPFGAGTRATWDLSLNYGLVNGTYVSTGGIRNSALAAAVGPGFADPTSATGYSCGTPESPIPGCVPLDLFGGAGSITPAQQGNLAFVGVTRNQSELLSAQANGTAELFRLLSQRPVGVAAGYEFRWLSGSFIPDPVTAAGDTSEGIVTGASGSYHVNEVYAELSVPVLSQLPLAEELEIVAAARLFKFSTTGGDWTYKLGARWQPVRDVALRGTWSTAYRAPSIFDLYWGGQRRFVEFDPCADLTGASPARVASCGAAGNNGGLGSPIVAGGNPHLRPETARVYTAGVVLEPRWVRNLALTADYYDVEITNVIGIPDPLYTCYPETPNVAPTGCEKITRNPVTQQVTSADYRLDNIGTEHVSGVDLAGRYVLPTEIGRFTLGVSATWLRVHDQEMPGVTLHGRGNTDLGVNPAWKANAQLGWRRNGVSAGVFVRFIGSLTECGDAQGNYGLTSGSLCSLDATYTRTISAIATADLNVGYDLATGAGTTSFTAGVRNVLDQEPPRVYNTFAGLNSDPTAYDFVGRFFWLRVAHRF